MHGPFQSFRLRICSGDRYCIPQLVIGRWFTPKFVEVSQFTEVKTKSGQKGFDSSGV